MGGGRDHAKPLRMHRAAPSQRRFIQLKMSVVPLLRNFNVYLRLVDLPHIRYSMLLNIQLCCYSLQNLLHRAAHVRNSSVSGWYLHFLGLSFFFPNSEALSDFFTCFYIWNASPDWELHSLSLFWFPGTSEVYCILNF